jgi:hypothetical protein
MFFGYPVASTWMSCCGIPTRKLCIILMKFLVMCVSAINCVGIPQQDIHEDATG